MKTFLFYDLETSGLNSSFHQILQFAAVRTDEKFNELESYNILVKLRPDVIPEPGAMITHRISLESLKNGISEYDLAFKLYELFNTPDTISLGYNSLSFDEEFIRALFFRNLLNPYSHQYMNNCKRMDIFPIVTAYKVFDDKSINYPIVDNKYSLKLEEFNKVNKLFEGQAHDALVDVRVTIELTKKLVRNKNLWDYLSESFEKNIELQRIQKLTTGLVINNVELPIAFIVSGRFGSQNNFCSVALQITYLDKYKNQSSWLRLDLFDFETEFHSVINESKAIVRRKQNGVELILPYSDKSKKILSNDKLELIEKNIKFLEKNNIELSKLISKEKAFEYELIEGYDIDAAIYMRNMFDRNEVKYSEEFRKAEINKKTKLIQSAPNEDIYELSQRIIFRNYYKDLDLEWLGLFNEFLKEVLCEDESKAHYDTKRLKRNNITKTEEEILKIRNERKLDEEQLKLLLEIENLLIEKKSLIN